jgi:hydroxymethylbilane synthase
MKITIGTRGSELALRQTDIVARALKTADASVSIIVHTIETRGDTDQNPIPLDTVGKGWFTQEIEDALRAGSIDIAVHSLKDLAEDMPAALTLAAYLPREDARDVLVTKNSEPFAKLRRGAVIGTDSIRRQVQMLALRKDVRMQSLRGNVPTRLKKLAEEPYDAAILAAAGLKRLGLEDKIVHYFDLAAMTPAPGQGILAVQAKRGDGPLQKLLKGITDRNAATAASLERAFAREVGAGCKSPVGAYAFPDGDHWHLIAMIAKEDGSRIVRGAMDALPHATSTLAPMLARKLLAELNEPHRHHA